MDEPHLLRNRVVSSDGGLGKQFKVIKYVIGFLSSSFLHASFWIGCPDETCESSS